MTSINLNKVCDDITETIGGTPLIKLRHASEKTGCTIYGKAEFMNPGCSMKARTALHLIKEAEHKGILVRGEPGTVVDATSGSFGVCVAQLARPLGYRCVIVMTDTNSKEKQDAIRQAGAELVLIPKAGPDHPNNIIKYTRRLTENLNNGKRVAFLNQVDNFESSQAHFQTTGPEIWNQLQGKVDGFSCSIGTGATLAGIAAYLRSVHSSVRIALTDPKRSFLVSYYSNGELKCGGESVIEGVGTWRTTGNLVDFKPDVAFEIADKEAWLAMEDAMQEGLFIGPSSGLNIAGAMRLAKEMGPGHTLVTVLCDLSSMHAKTVFNRDFLESNQLPVPEWLNNAEKSDLEEAMDRTFISEDVVEATTVSNLK